MPIFGIGTSPIVHLFVNTPEAKVQQALNKAWELGIRYYDPEPWYGHGLSEHRLGSLLRQHERKKYFISINKEKPCDGNIFIGTPNAVSSVTPHYN